MIKFRALLVGVAALSLASAGQTQAPPADFTPEAFRAHVAFLADDMLEGREAGTRGYDLAARYVASQFERLGLQPASEGQWLQPVEFVRYSTSGTPTLAINDRTYTHKSEVIFRATPSSSPLSLNAPVVFVGHGLDLPAQGFNDYDGLDVRGKIVVVLGGYPDGTPSDVGAHLNSEKQRMAAARGALGMLTLRTDEEEATFPWDRMLHYADRPGTTWVGKDGQPYSGSGLGFSATLSRPVAETLFAGASRTLRQVLAEAKAGGKVRGFALKPNARVEREPAEITRFSSPNVVAVLPGTDASLTDEYVLMMAHLDGLGIGGEEEDRIRNGAMDNATGVSTLIEVAREMSEPGNRPRRPILFAAVTAEEKGLLGAEFLARNPVTSGRVVSVVNLDMPILTYDFQDVIAFGAEHSTLGPIVSRAAQRMGVALSEDPLPQEGLFTRSDHYKFVREGVPSVFLMTGFEGEGQERFTGFLSDVYHGPSDDINLPFDWQAGAKFARLNYLIAREIADAPEAPAWYADSFFGDVFGGESQRAQRGNDPLPRAGRTSVAR